ncbi:MAG: hypothetical protein IH944_12970 [Armatimonadetes bacterium]|nr:hypothetical protein [Armatimonadota bacterium]
MVSGKFFECFSDSVSVFRVRPYQANKTMYSSVKMSQAAVRLENPLNFSAQELVLIAWIGLENLIGDAELDEDVGHLAVMQVYQPVYSGGHLATNRPRNLAQEI